MSPSVSARISLTSTATSSASSSTSTSVDSTPQLSPQSSPPTSPSIGSTSSLDGKLGKFKLDGTLGRDGEGRKEMPAEWPKVPRNAVIERVDERDKGTPDAWVERDERLVRLTGKHPFNCEAKLDTLFAQGFLTPSELFYVRNHGAVPSVDEEKAKNWRIDICGQVANPVQLSIQDLKDKFETVTLPVTLVCAGNRRKEQNVVRKGLGFNWGAAGVSTALFTGIYLADLLDYVKPIRHPETGARAAHVVFEGADQLPQGPYGTSQLLSWAKNKERGMLIAWAMNGQALTPDHGFPIRLVCPGQIGGRMVKWLTKIEISHQESQHYLHFWDNKFLPTQVMPEEARAEKKWWYDPKYIINELNTNSAIAKPDHNEIYDTNSADGYTLKGYAYSGGGRRVARIEVSTDDGKSWTLADIFYPEDLYRAVAYEDEIYGKLDLTDRDTCYAWCFWSLKVNNEELKNSDVLMVRAMDEGLSGQPRDMYWNATSMMNNWYFRTAVHHQEDGHTLRFEHPTLAGVAQGGWMERLKDEGQDILKPIFGKPEEASSTLKVTPPPKQEVSMVSATIKRIITAEEFAAHSGAEEPWFAVKGEVYDGTPFLKDHPGGGESIMLVAGQDATEDFMSIHSPQGKAMLAQYHIGTLEVKEGVAPKEEAEEVMEPVFLNKTKWKKAKLVEIENLSHDSRLYRFALQSDTQLLGLPTGQHVFVRLRRKIHNRKSNGKVQHDIPTETEVLEGELVQRAYTPVSPQNAKGHIDMLIKLYLPNKDWPEGGKMTTGFNDLEVGESIEFKGPLGSFVYHKDGRCTWRGVERTIKKFGMICAGSGITPILQVARGIFEGDDGTGDGDAITEAWCIDSNKTADDILCRKELDIIEQKSAGRFHLHHTLSATPPDWPSRYSKGRINIDMLRDNLPAPADDALLMICGPDGLINHTVKPALIALGWDIEKQLVVF